MRVELTFSGLQSLSFPEHRLMVRMEGIEPSSLRWQRGALPLSYTRKKDA